MNCRQVEELLPLYTGGDLDEKRERLIADHVRRCVGCAALSDEFDETRELIGEIAPQLSENVYAGIRQEVWRQIEAEANRPSRWPVVPDFWPRRVAWGLASAVLITVFMLAIYFIGNRGTRPQVAGNGGETNQNRRTDRPGEQPKPSNSEAPPSRSAGTSGPNLTHLKQPRRRFDRKVGAERATSLAANSPAAPNPSVEPSAPADSHSEGETQLNSDNPLRMEIQTTDPNIRIIWFAQRETKPTKGT
jgi:hypothetical protein